jgi:hypothetical protein
MACPLPEADMTVRADSHGGIEGHFAVRADGRVYPDAFETQSEHRSDSDPGGASCEYCRHLPEDRSFLAPT